MAIITRSIGSGKDHPTIADWASKLDDSGIYSASDEAVGETYDEVYDESFTINGGGTIGLAKVTLSAEATNRHDGTAGTGARCVWTSDKRVTFSTPSGFDDKYIIEWMEFDKNGNAGIAITGQGQQFQNVGRVQNCLVHGGSGASGDATNGIIYAGSRDLRVQNCFIFDHSRSSTGTVYGIQLDSDRATGGCLNNTVHDIKNPSSGTAIGLHIVSNDADGRCKNCISTDSKTTDFEYAANCDDSNNLSSDDTADDNGGSGHLISKASSNQFTSNSDPYNLQLKTGADAIDAGVDLIVDDDADDVEFDILNRNRDTEGDTWDIGAHELVAAGGGATPKGVFGLPLHGPLAGPI